MVLHWTTAGCGKRPECGPGGRPACRSDHRQLATAFMTQQVRGMQTTSTPTPKNPRAEPPPARLLSPRRKTTTAATLPELALEQLEHFHIDPTSPTGQPLLALAEKL